VHDGAYLGLAQSGYLSKRRINWARFDAQGQIAAQQRYIEDIRPDIADAESVVAAFIPLGVWAPVTICTLIATDDDSLEFEWEDAWEAAKEDPARTAQAVLVLLLQSIAGVPLAMWAARRRRLDKRPAWLCIAWGFLLGPAGSLSVLAVYPRIARDRCVSCQQPTRIDLDHCEHCGQPAGEVARLGIEIFDRDPLATSSSTETISSC
jgi:hypothetical protein